MDHATQAINGIPAPSESPVLDMLSQLATAIATRNGGWRLIVDQIAKAVFLQHPSATQSIKLPDTEENRVIAVALLARLNSSS